MNTQNENNKNQNKIIKDVPRFENDIYRICAWTGKKGDPFLDLHVFYRKDGGFKKAKEGMNILEKFRREVATALMTAKNDPELPMPTDGKKCETRLVTAVEISETQQYQISKVRGPKNSSVRICYAAKGDNGNFIPSGKKALSILESSIDGVVDALSSMEPDTAERESMTQAA